MVNSDAILYYADHAVEFVQDIIQAEPDPAQKAILRSVCDNQMTSVRSGHGIGKSAVEAWAVIWFMVTRPFPKVPCTAPTQHQLYDILWAEISKWLRNCAELGNELVWTKEKLYLASHPEEWFAVGRTASHPDALQGFHADHLFFVIDEASGVKDVIFEPVLGALSTPGSKLLMCGNPTKLTGFFYDSHNKNRASYHTFKIDGRDSPRVSRDYIERMRSMYGEDSNVFRVRVTGDFPTAEDDVFISLPLVEQATMTELPEDRRIDKITFGVDVARFGDDETIIAKNVAGDISLPVIRHGQDLMKTVGDIVRLYRDTLEEIPEYTGPITVNIDDTGLGGGVTDRLEEVKYEDHLTRLEIVPVNYSSAPPDDDVGERYQDIATYMWATLKALLVNEQIRLQNDDDLVAQLSVRKYSLNSRGKIVLETKKQMKERDIKSPDRADAVTLSCFRQSKAYAEFVKEAERIIIPVAAVPTAYIETIAIGISIAENGKGTALVATAILSNYARVVALDTEIIQGGESDAIEKAFSSFSRRIIADYGQLDYTYIAPDELVLFKGIRAFVDAHGIDVSIRKAANAEVAERITLTNRLLAQNRLSITEKCEALGAALTQAGAAEKRQKAGRAKSRNEAVLRAFEYTIERDRMRFAEQGGLTDV